MSWSNDYPKNPDAHREAFPVAARRSPAASWPGMAFAARPDATLGLIHEMQAASLLSLGAWFTWPALFMGAAPTARPAFLRIPDPQTVTSISSPSSSDSLSLSSPEPIAISDPVPGAAVLAPGPVVVDVAGTVLTDAERERLRHPLVGAVILFARNFSTRAELTQLTAEIHAARQGPLLIAVDHEGGRVQRFRTDGFTVLPAMRTLGEQWMHDPMGAMRRATDIGYVLAAELRACGVDFSFAPVLDLDYGGSTVIGTRAFHDDPRVVAMLARAVAQGMALAGMGACGKHFPGHGFVNADSHVAIPVDERPLEDILAKDAAPYRWLGDAVLPAVMPAHVIYPKVDKHPAGFSKKWIKTILRGKLAYDGVVFSDDLSMEGASVAGDMLARAKAALAAGCDMVLVCNRPDLADDLLARLSHRPDPASTARIRRLTPVTAAPDWDTLQAMPRFQAARHAARAEG
jgi:beta-N-acetylhexosaminidase